TQDFDAMKKKQIERIKKMPEEDFKKELTRYCEKFKGSNLEGIYGISPDSSKEKVIAAIKKLDKKEINTCIDKVSNTFIAEKVKRFFSNRHMTYASKNDFLTNIKLLWNDILHALIPS
ncbi:MAG: hypothetical protein V1893_00100, partial [Candidatus Omnitrophota bacterium]